MLRPPYQRYERLHVYHLDAVALPAVTDPDLIGIWLEDGSPILFFHQAKEELIGRLCHEHGCRVIYQADLDYSDWEAGQDIAPFSLAGLTVAPVWAEETADIRLDPSVIFGTGFHPSTRLCLETLGKYCRTPELKLESMLDLGTGTGLLAIAAARLGLSRITGVDHNPLACEVARQNVELNQCGDKITIRQLDLRREEPDTGVDLVVANLYHHLLAELFARPSFWRARLYLVAGFIPSMEEELLAALPAHRVRLLERRRSERWCLWVLAPNTVSEDTGGAGLIGDR
jgi:ribosomal protein L11 methyltransferase